MLNKCSNLFKKSGIEPKDIVYIKRDGRNNALHLVDGRVVHTYIPAKTVAAETADSAVMLNVNKGVYLAENYIVNINNGIYTMSDGASFKGRVRTPGEHKLNAERISAKNFPALTICLWRSALSSLNLTRRATALISSSATATSRWK